LIIIASILQRLDIDESEWLMTVKHFHHRFYRMIGKLQRLEQVCHDMGQYWLKGLASAKALYLNQAT